MDSLIRGLSTTVIGIIVVIATLALIALVISIMGRIMRQKPKGKTLEISKAEPAPSPSAAQTDNLELVAVITAAVSAYTLMSPERFKILNIKPSEAESWRKTNRKTTDF